VREKEQRGRLWCGAEGGGKKVILIKMKQKSLLNDNQKNLSIL
jgi:hypothetical protein